MTKAEARYNELAERDDTQVYDERNDPLIPCLRVTLFACCPYTGQNVYMCWALRKHSYENGAAGRKRPSLKFHGRLATADGRSKRISERSAWSWYKMLRAGEERHEAHLRGLASDADRSSYKDRVSNQLNEFI